jgi:putative phosphoribosyl transferase
MSLRFRNRTEAGQLLAAQLLNDADLDYVHQPNGIVLALPRGGVPVAYEIAQRLGWPLDVCLVRKLGVPGQEELAMGAIGADGVVVLNQEVLKSLHISQAALRQVAERENRELRRRLQVYRGDRPPAQVENCTIILVDDGIATGSTVRAAIGVLQRQHPARMIVATPIAPAVVCEALRQRVEAVVCLSTPDPLQSIGLWYDDFSQTSDAEVCQLLEQAAQQAV